MVHVALRAVGGVVAGLAGITVLSTGANVVSVVAEATRRVGVALINRTVGYDTTKAPDEQVNIDNYGLRPLLPYAPVESSRNPRYTDWQSLGTAGIKNAVAAVVAMYVVCRFAPSMVTHANKLLNYVTNLQFAKNFPVTKLGL